MKNLIFSFVDEEKKSEDKENKDGKEEKKENGKEEKKDEEKKEESDGKFQETPILHQNLLTHKTKRPWKNLTLKY